MDRRQSIKSMIALAVAPPLIKIEMLMPVKSIVSVMIPMSGCAFISEIQDLYNMERSLWMETLLEITRSAMSIERTVRIPICHITKKTI